VGGGRGKLAAVARLYWADRAKYGRTCGDCARHQYDEATGEVVPDRTRARKGLPMLRPKGGTPPCDKCPKTLGVSPRHHTAPGFRDPPAYVYRAFAYHRAGAATGWAGAAVDAIVRRTAAVVAAVRDGIEAARADTLTALLTARAALHGR